MKLVGTRRGEAGRPRRAASTGILLALLALPLWGQAPPSTSEPSFAGGTQVLSVEVPVQVVRGGEPVRGLTAADFEVWEGRRRVPIAGFEALDLAAFSGPGQASSLPSAARRHFLFLFDLAFSEPASIARARQAAAGLLGRLHPTDLMAVATYSAARGPQLVLGFSSDRRQIESALDSLGLPGQSVRPLDPLRLVIQELLGASNAAGGTLVPLNRDPLEDTFEIATEYRFDAIIRSVQGADRAALRNHIGNFTRSLSGLARQMSVVEGRKYLVFLSEGFDSTLIQGTSDEQRQVEMREDTLQGEFWRVDPEERYGVAETGNDLERMLEELRRADCVIQAVDIGGVRAGAEQITPRLGGRDSLLMMTKGTGGDLYESFNNLGEAMEQMLKRTGVTYVLAVEPDAPAAGAGGATGAGGEYRRLRVELKKPLPGARVVHRPGYHLPKPFTQQDPIEKLLEAANQVMSGEESDAVSTAVLAAPFKSAGEKAYVPVLIEIDGATLLAGRQPPTTLPVEVYVYALDTFGAVHDFLTQTLGVDLARTEAVLRQGGVTFFGHLDLMPGDYSLRVLVRNAATGVSGLRVVPLRVPDFAQGEPALLPPLFPHASERWLVIEEEARGEGKPDYPFLLRNQPFVPASRPVLTPGTETRLVLAGANLSSPGSESWKPEARVLTLEGQEIPGARLEVVELRKDRAVALFRPPAGLKPGEYVLRITVPGTPEAASNLRFVIAPSGARG